MLYRTFKRLVEMGHVDGLRERLDVIYAAGNSGLTAEQYQELTAMLEGEA